MRKLLMILSIFLTVNSFAYAEIQTSDLNFSGLTETQKAQLVSEAEKMRNTPSTTSMAQLGEYANFGKAFGSAIAETAKELGATANEFVTTPVGQIATVLIIWKVAGASILGFIIGSVWFLVLLPLWIYYFNKLVVAASTNTVSVTENGVTTVTTTLVKNQSAEEIGRIQLTKSIFCIALLLLLGLGLIIIL